ncbi:MAG: PEP-CTERM sorting domain-containing protein [Verrucomicrobiota bacterium JB023]|nr:PEP-CTERM sorting domain-containing protein [Verrucomicrobiota bacterium JB023]
MNTFNNTLTLVACGAAFVSSAGAATLVDTFDSGLGNWTTSGDVAIHNAGSNPAAVLTTAHSTLEFSPDDINVSGADPLEAGGDLETAVGVTVGALDLDAFDMATEGSAMSLTIVVAAGDTLTFDWTLATLDGFGLDYGFLAIDGAVVQILSSADATLSTGGGFGTETAVATVSHEFANAGEVTISLGVTDITDYAGTTSLFVDNVQVIPEPSAAWLGLIGFASLLRRRRA